MIKKILLLWLLLLFSSIVNAAPSEWQIVPSESSITFTGTQNGAPATGSFKKFTGEINLDSQQIDASKVRIVIDMQSLAMSYSTFTETLLTADWFDVKKFPQAIFQSTHVSKIKDNQYQVDGTLSVRDKTVPISLTFTAQQLSNSKGKATGMVTLKRLAFGVGQGDWADTSVVKDEVQVNFVIVAVKK